MAYPQTLGFCSTALALDCLDLLLHSIDGAGSLLDSKHYQSQTRRLLRFGSSRRIFREEASLSQSSQPTVRSLSLSTTTMFNSQQPDIAGYIFAFVAGGLFGLMAFLFSRWLIRRFRQGPRVEAEQQSQSSSSDAPGDVDVV